MRFQPQDKHNESLYQELFLLAADEDSVSVTARFVCFISMSVSEYFEELLILL